MIPSYQQGRSRGDSKFFELLPLSHTTFHKKPPVQPHSSSSSSTRPSSTNLPRSGRPPSGSVTCYVPFRTRDQGSREYLAVGCEEGVWIGVRGRDETFQKVMSVKHVQQIEFLAEAELILLLADNALFFYPLSTLLASSAPPAAPISRIPSPTPPSLSSRSSSSALRPQHQSSSSASSTTRARSPNRNSNTIADHQSPQRLSGQAKVQFFQVGTLQGRSLVIYAKKKGMNDCVFRCLEWVVAGDGAGGRKADKFGSWRLFKEFFIPSEAHFIKFLRSKVAIGCEKGVEILDLTTLQGGTIPVLPAVAPGVAALASTFGLNSNGNGGAGFDPTPQVELTLAALAKKCEGAVPLGIGRVDQGDREGEFLLVYETFAIYLSSKGGHPTPPLIPISFSTHSTSSSFSGNHLLLVSANFIEVRNVATGELVQMMSGKNVRKVWEERGTWREVEGLPAYDAAGPQGSVDGERRGRLGVVMDEVGGGGGGGESEGVGVGQIIYELVPTRPELALPLLPPPSIGAESYPPSPPLAGLERTRSFARPASGAGPPTLAPVDVDTDLVDYFHAL